MSKRLLAGLNPQQLEAVRHRDGPLLVLAGAGTGKTRVVTVRIAHLLAEGVRPEHVLAVTFTNKAAREMRERVAPMVGKDAAAVLTISTFHSLAIRLLRQYGDRLGYRKNFGIADEEERSTLLRAILRETGISEKEISPRWGVWQISSWKNLGLDPAGALEAACDDAEIKLAIAYRSMQQEMRRRQVMDFDDMIMLGLELFAEHPDVLDQCRDRFRYLMVDEYQDTNSTQYEFIRHLAGARRNIMVVGDDDQSIYGWRGARAGNILDFAKHYQGAKVVTLAQNYRSTNVILRAANRVIGNNTVRMKKELWSALGEGKAIELHHAEDERDELLHLMGRLTALKAKGRSWESMAILFRANQQSNAIEVYLRERQIPYRVVGTRSLFDRRECKDLLAYLKLIANPMDDGALLRIINTPARGIGRGSQDRLIAEATRRRCATFELILSGELEGELRGPAAGGLAEFRATMTEVRDLAEAGRLGDAIELLLEKIDYRNYLEMDARDELDAQVRWNVLGQILELARSFEDKHRGEGVLAAYLESLALDERPKKDDEDFGLTMLTVHAAKGLEYDQVFLVGLEEGIFPHKNSFGDDDNLDTIDEERRLFYVAVTRARRELYLSLARTRRRYGRDEEREASRFLAELGDQDIELVDPAAQGPAEDEVVGDYLSRLKGLFGSSES
ncbi:MAG: UvrD-helicase domain-containing protein [Planctomycetes bacterium]|nr:UvrD-helicase domain-containing protein [Planctomycetota bacterium]